MVKRYGVFLLFIFSLYSHDTDKAITVDRIIERIYYVGRLKAPVALLVKLHKKRLLSIANGLAVKDKQVLFQGFLFRNERLKKTIEQFCFKKKLDVILKLWINIGHYQYLDDPTIVKEFAVLVLTFLYSTVEKIVPNISFEVSSKSRLFSEHHFETLSLEEVLDILDILVDELPEFLEKYEFGSDISWQEWLKKYWLIAPLALAAFLLRIYLTGQTHTVRGDQGVMGSA